MHRPTIHKEGQAGQAIVLIAIMMVALIASLGLAIDGGGMYLLYRDAQNAVDSAALTSAFALCTGGDPVEAGLHSLELNGFDSASLSANSGVFNPPRVGSGYDGDLTMVEITLDVDKPSYFIQIVYGGDLNVTVTAISQCAGSPAVAATNVDEQYAFRSLRNPNECSSSPAWDIAGSRFTIEGDVWMPNIGTNIEFNSNNTPDPTVADNPADILGNIYVGRSSANQAIVDGNGRETLVEDLPGSPAGDPFPSNYTGYGGDGTIEFSQPAPSGLSHTMDYYRPAGSARCSTAECGGLQALYPTQYHDVSDSCNTGNKIEYQDFGQNINPSDFNWAPYYDVPNTEWTSGIYYSTCEVTLNNASNMNGSVTFISEEQFDLSSGPYQLTAFGDAPLFVTNKNSSGSGNNVDVQNCSGGSYGIQFNADNSYLQGRIIAYRGYVAIQGNDYIFETCISAAGIKQNGNNNSLFQCTPAQNDAQREVRLIQ